MIPKFRAWDKKTKSMWNIDSWHVEDEYFDLIEPNKSVADPNANRVWRKESDVILMQSTGLFDKNGVDVFEGDVVNINHTFRNPMTGSGTLTLNKNFEVVFINGMFTRYGSSMGLGKDLKYITVIGNVHDNPDLLESVEE